MSGYLVAAAAALALALAAMSTAWRLDRSHDALAALAVAAGIVALVLAIGAGVGAAESTSCERRGAAMERETRYGFWTGCLVRLADGRWVPLDSYRLTDELEEP